MMKLIIIALLLCAYNTTEVKQVLPVLTGNQQSDVVFGFHDFTIKAILTPTANANIKDNVLFGQDACGDGRVQFRMMINGQNYVGFWIAAENGGLTMQPNNPVKSQDAGHADGNNYYTQLMSQKPIIPGQKNEVTLIREGTTFTLIVNGDKQTAQTSGDPNIISDYKFRVGGRYQGKCGGDGNSWRDKFQGDIQVTVELDGKYLVNEQPEFDIGDKDFEVKAVFYPKNGANIFDNVLFSEDEACYGPQQFRVSIHKNNYVGVWVFSAEGGIDARPGQSYYSFDSADGNNYFTKLTSQNQVIVGQRNTLILQRVGTKWTLNLNGKEISVDSGKVLNIKKRVNFRIGGRYQGTCGGNHDNWINQFQGYMLVGFNYIQKEVLKCAQLFSECNYQGDLTEVCADTPASKITYQVKSIKVPTGQVLEVYKYENFKGEKIEVTENKACYDAPIFIKY